MMFTCCDCEKILPASSFTRKDKLGRLNRRCKSCEAEVERNRRAAGRKVNGNWLMFGCTHLPYQHPDLFRWLEALNAKYSFGRVIHLGDLYDWANVSRHGTNPNMRSPNDEYAETIPVRERLYAIFPKAHMVSGNHDVRYLIQAAEAGIPDIVVLGMRQAMGLPEGWVEHGTNVEIEHPHLGPVVFVHGDKVPKNPTANAKNCGKHFVMADRHTQAKVEWGSPLLGKSLFGMSTGCGIDESRLAFKYSKKFIPRPIISVGAIIDNVPVVITMQMNDNHEWTGKI